MIKSEKRGLVLESALLYIIAGAAVIMLALTIYIIHRIKNLNNESKIAELEKQIAQVNTLAGQTLSRSSEEFERNRRETGESLRVMSDKLENMTRQNYEMIMKLNKDMTDSLNVIRENNADQNERQTRVLDSASPKCRRATRRSSIR